MSSAKKRGKSQLTPLSQTLGRAMTTGFLNFTAQKLRVFDLWPQVVGPEDAARTRPDVLHNGRLTVLVPGSIWLDHFSYKKGQWIEDLNRELADQALIDEIILKIGEF